MANSSIKVSNETIENAANESITTTIAATMTKDVDNNKDKQAEKKGMV